MNEKKWFVNTSVRKTDGKNEDLPDVIVYARTISGALRKAEEYKKETMQADPAIRSMIIWGVCIGADQEVF